MIKILRYFRILKSTGEICQNAHIFKRVNGKEAHMGRKQRYEEGC